MDISRRGFLKLLAAIPAIAVVAKAESVLPFMQDPALTEEDKENYWEGYEEFELKFDEFSLGAHSLRTLYGPPVEVFGWAQPVTAVYQTPAMPELAFSSYCGKNFRKVHTYFTSWVDSVMLRPVAPKRASLIYHGRQESLKLAEFDALFPKSIQVDLRETFMVFDATLVIADTKLYQENFEKCQNILG